MWFNGVASVVVCKSTLLVAVLCATAQAGYTDSRTGIHFESAARDGITFGWALPKNNQNELIGQLIAPRNTGYAGVSFGGSMFNSLLFTAWESSGKIKYDLRYSQRNKSPAANSKGRASIRILKCGTNADKTHWSITFMCSGCNSWPGSASATSFGYAVSNKPPYDPNSPQTTKFHGHDRSGSFKASLSSAKSEKFSTWAKKCQ